MLLSDKELSIVKKIYLNGNTWIVAVGTVIGIPFAKSRAVKGREVIEKFI
ncbi:MAG: hypothetical protein HDR09_20745 [Lachnospiraceae bacterium]|nr:hypothetical protein [Lachnospiraceae bacterium]MBD5506104.1 hypothetical protein [Lachnospiraceae bacterium]